MGREELKLVWFNDLQIGEWFRIDIGGEPGWATIRKTFDSGGRSGKQYVKINNQQIWWVKNYFPHPDEL